MSDEFKNVNLLDLELSFLSFLVVELRVGQTLESLSCLLMRNKPGALKVVKGVDVLQVGLAVNDATVTIYLLLLQLFNEEGLDVLRLSECDKCGQIFEELENLVLS